MGGTKVPHVKKKKYQKRCFTISLLFRKFPECKAAKASPKIVTSPDAQFPSLVPPLEEQSEDDMQVPSMVLSLAVVQGKFYKRSVILVVLGVSGWQSFEFMIALYLKSNNIENTK